MTPNDKSIAVTSAEQQQKAQKRDLLKYMSLFGGMQGLNMLIALVRNKLTAIFLGTAGLGILNLFNSALQLIQSLSNLGIPFSTVRHLSAISTEDDGSQRAQYVQVVRCWSLIVGGLGFCICFFLAPYLSRWSFESDAYTTDFRWLSIAVALTTLSACELALLKAIRKMNAVIRISWMSALGSLLLVAPIYGWMGKAGIPLVLFLIAVWITVITYAHTLRIFPFKGHLFKSDTFTQGFSLVQLGVSMIFAGIFATGSEYLLRTIILKIGTMDDVALYNAGRSILIVYLGSAFAAIDNDFFTKLTGLIHKKRARNQLINSQFEIALLVITPMIVGVLIFLPWLVPLLYSSEFSQAATVIQFGSYFLFFRAFTLPMSYTLLTQNDTKWYLMTEFGYAVLTVLLLAGGFHWDGLRGLGIGLTLMGLIDFICLRSITHVRYGLRLSSSTRKTTAILFLLLSGSFLWSFITPSAIYYVVGSILFVATLIIVLYLLSKRTDWVSAVRHKF